ncbi:MAG: hypothetical protein ABJI24_08060 [Lentilitoribacter sp.]
MQENRTSSPCRCPIATRRRNRGEQTKVHEHAAATRDKTSTQWNRRRMIESAKDSGHYPDPPMDLSALVLQGLDDE